MKRNMGIIFILVGVGVLFISIFFSSGYSKYDIRDGHRRTIMENIYQMEIILSSSSKVLISGNEGLFDPIRSIKNKNAIPLKYLLTFSVVLILFGTGILLLKEKFKTRG